MSSRLPIQVLVPLCLFLVGAGTQAAGISQATMLSNSCSACHGTDGKSPGAIPGINGKTASFIASALKEFRDGTRTSTVMGRHATGYSDEEIQLIADYFAGLE
jgi:sulfide dehydrogenase cytochrome subunit